MTPQADLGARRPDRASPIPLWAQVCDDLRRRITTGEFEAGFPGELSLTEGYEVSRHTIREALRVLREEGLIRRERGRGTTLERRRIAASMGTLYSLFDTMNEQGIDQSSEVRRLARTTNAVVAAALGMAADTELIVLERLRCADGEPLAVDTSWLPASIAGPLLDADFTATGLYSELARRCGVNVDSGSERITALIAPRHIGDLLEVPGQSSVFAIERLARSGSMAVEWRETYIRGDRFSLDVSWSPQSSLITATTDSGTN
jgi:GntR family transcriptional regulator